MDGQQTTGLRPEGKQGCLPGEKFDHELGKSRPSSAQYKAEAYEASGVKDSAVVQWCGSGDPMIGRGCCFTSVPPAARSRKVRRTTR